MTRLELEVDNRHIEVEATFDSSDGHNKRMVLIIDGRRIEAEVSEPEPGSILLIIDHRVFRCTREPDHTGGLRLTVNGRPMSVRARDRKHLRGHESHESGLMLLTSPMPGKVVSLLLGPGNLVEARQGVVIVEAMKMQNEVQAPRAGRIIEVRVSPGQTVNAGEVLAVVE